MPKDLESHLAKRLWFYQMGVLLFWIYDRSAQQKRSRRLLNASVPVVVMLVTPAGLPIFKTARKNVLNIITVLASQERSRRALPVLASNLLDQAAQRGRRARVRERHAVIALEIQPAKIRIVRHGLH